MYIGKNIRKPVLEHDVSTAAVSISVCLYALRRNSRILYVVGEGQRGRGAYAHTRTYTHTHAIMPQVLAADGAVPKVGNIALLPFRYTPRVGLTRSFLCVCACVRVRVCVHLILRHSDAQRQRHIYT